MAAMGFTEVDATRAALIASIVQETLKQSSIFMGTVSDYSGWAPKGAKSVAIPRRTQLAAADKTENTDLTAQEMTFSVDTIALDKYKAIFVELERHASLQSSVDVQAQLIKEMALELALQVDKDLYVQMKLASASAPDHRVAFANTSTLGKADILTARKLLNIQNVPMDARWLAVNPLHESELLAISEFVEADKYGSSQGLVNGELGRLFGFRVIMSNVVEDNNVIAYHQTAVGLAMQQQPQFEMDKNLKNVADQFLLHEVYGVKVLDTGKRQVLIGTAT